MFCVFLGGFRDPPRLSWNYSQDQIRAINLRRELCRKYTLGSADEFVLTGCDDQEIADNDIVSAVYGDGGSTAEGQNHRVYLRGRRKLRFPLSFPLMQHGSWTVRVELNDHQCLFAARVSPDVLIGELLAVVCKMHDLPSSAAHRRNMALMFRDKVRSPYATLRQILDEESLPPDTIVLQWTSKNRSEREVSTIPKLAVPMLLYDGDFHFVCARELKSVYNGDSGTGVFSMVELPVTPSELQMLASANLGQDCSSHCWSCVANLLEGVARQLAGQSSGWWCDCDDWVSCPTYQHRDGQRENGLTKFRKSIPEEVIKLMHCYVEHLHREVNPWDRPVHMTLHRDHYRRIVGFSIPGVSIGQQSESSADEIEWCYENFRLRNDAQLNDVAKASLVLRGFCGVLALIFDRVFSLSGPVSASTELSESFLCVETRAPCDSAKMSGHKQVDFEPLLAAFLFLCCTVNSGDSSARLGSCVRQCFSASKELMKMINQGASKCEVVQASGQALSSVMQPKCLVGTNGLMDHCVVVLHPDRISVYPLIAFARAYGVDQPSGRSFVWATGKVQKEDIESVGDGTRLSKLLEAHGERWIDRERDGEVCRIVAFYLWIREVLPATMWFDCDNVVSELFPDTQTHFETSDAFLAYFWANDTFARAHAGSVCMPFLREQLRVVLWTERELRLHYEAPQSEFGVMMECSAEGCRTTREDGYRGHNLLVLCINEDVITVEGSENTWAEQVFIREVRRVVQLEQWTSMLRKLHLIALCEEMRFLVEKRDVAGEPTVSGRELYLGERIQYLSKLTLCGHSRLSDLREEQLDGMKSLWARVCTRFFDQGADVRHEPLLDSKTYFCLDKDEPCDEGFRKFIEHLRDWQVSCISSVSQAYCFPSVKCEALHRMDDIIDPLLDQIPEEDRHVLMVEFSELMHKVVLFLTKHVRNRLKERARDLWECLYGDVPKDPSPQIRGDLEDSDSELDGDFDLMHAADFSRSGSGTDAHSISEAVFPRESLPPERSRDLRHVHTGKLSYQSLQFEHKVVWKAVVQSEWFPQEIKRIKQESTELDCTPPWKMAVELFLDQYPALCNVVADEGAEEYSLSRPFLLFAKCVYELVCHCECSFPLVNVAAWCRTQFHREVHVSYDCSMRLERFTNCVVIIPGLQKTFDGTNIKKSHVWPVQ